MKRNAFQYLSVLALATAMLFAFSGCKSAVDKTETYKLSFTSTTLSVAIGTTGTVSASTTGSTITNGKISWSSADPTIATVDSSGTVTGVAKGTVVITGTYGTASATCTVTVSSFGVTLSTTEFAIAPAETYTVTATSNQSGITTTWTSSDTSVATVTSAGVVTGVANGTATITVKATNSSETATKTISVLVCTLGSNLLAKYDFESSIGSSLAPVGGNNPITLYYATDSTSSQIAAGSSSPAVSGYNYVTTTTSTASYSGMTISKILPSSATAMTVSAWVKATSDWSTLFMTGYCWVDLPNLYWNAGTATSAATWVYPSSSVDPGTFYNNYTYAGIMTGSWVYVTIVVDPSTGITWYANGQEMVNYPTSGTNISSAISYIISEAKSDTTYIATNAGTPAGISLEDLRFYNKAVTSTEAAALYTSASSSDF